ncbi:MAG: hypothetical protein ACLT2T_04335 [Bilophila wadsworthia]
MPLRKSRLPRPPCRRTGRAFCRRSGCGGFRRRDAAEIERIVDAALDAKLSPIKRMLAEQAEAGPNLRDIIGGIGWILG